MMDGARPSLVRRLLPDAFWTLANNVISVLGGLAVVKLVSLLVPAGDYGDANLSLGIVALLTLFIVNPVLTAQLRLYFDHARPGAASSYVRSVEPLLLRCAGLMTGPTSSSPPSTRSRSRGSTSASRSPPCFCAS